MTTRKKIQRSSGNRKNSGVSQDAARGSAAGQLTQIGRLSAAKLLDGARPSATNFAKLATLSRKPSVHSGMGGKQRVSVIGPFRLQISPGFTSSGSMADIFKTPSCWPAKIN
jgi:hypothetical protein